MKNSIYNDFYPQSNPMMNLISQFNQFRSTFSGNPETQVKQLIQSGRMTQEQFDQLAQFANQIRPFLK